MRNNFIPESRLYGDRHPRTLEEAFGPGARLDLGNPHEATIEFVVRAGLGFAVAVLFLWAVSQLK